MARVVVLVGLSLVLAACGTTTGSPVSPPSSPPFSTSAASSPSPAPPLAASSTSAGTDAVAGVIRRGALPRCLVLYADDGRHFVLDGAGDPPIGVPVVVRGRTDAGTASFCNAGATLRVEVVTPR